jgi:hypothetical protein
MPTDVKLGVTAHGTVKREKQRLITSVYFPGQQLVLPTLLVIDHPELCLVRLVECHSG